jgi:hypothetical protein
MIQSKPSRAALLAACLGILAACGGGTDGTGSPVPSGIGITTSGVMTKGSVIVNGVRFDDSAATVTDDRGRSAASLANGMVVKLRGRRTDSGSGVAERIDVENELRAAISSIDPSSSPQSFVAAGITVLVESGTVFVNAAGFAGLSEGARVEVHGLRDAAGKLRASRVELVGTGAGADELRGAASLIDTGADSFVINGNISVNYAGAAFSPAGTSEASLRSGTVVEIRGTLAGNVFTATQVDLEDLQDDNLLGRADEEQEVEGYVSGFTAHPGSFLVNGRSVRTTSSTRFEDGSAGDLVNNVKVEVEGVVDAQGVLVASTVEFRNIRVQLHGRATAVDAAVGTIVVLGQTVRATNLTRIESRGSGDSTSLADVVPNVDCVEVRATVEGSSIVADEIKEPESCGKELVQAAVSAKNESTSTLTFFGTLNASLAGTTRFLDRNEQAISRAQFFAAVVPASATSLGTLVEVEGTSLGSVEKAELED